MTNKPLDLIWASPECIHVATDDRTRAQRDSAVARHTARVANDAEFHGPGGVRRERWEVEACQTSTTVAEECSTCGASHVDGFDCFGKPVRS